MHMARTCQQKQHGMKKFQACVIRCPQLESHETLTFYELFDKVPDSCCELDKP